MQIERPALPPLSFHGVAKSPSSQSPNRWARYRNISTPQTRKTGPSPGQQNSLSARDYRSPRQRLQANRISSKKETPKGQQKKTGVSFPALSPSPHPPTELSSTEDLTSPSSSHSSPSNSKRRLVGQGYFDQFPIEDGYFRALENLGLTIDQIRSLVRQSRRDVVAQGQYVVRQGDIGDSWYLILKGAFDVLILSNGAITKAQTLGPGQSFGELALVRNAPRAASVVAVETGELMRVVKDDFDRVLKSAHQHELTSNYAFLRSLEALETVSDKAIQKLADIVTYKSYAAGQMIARTAQPASHIFFVKSGVAQVYKEVEALPYITRSATELLDPTVGPGPIQRLILGTLRQGDSFGATVMDNDDVALRLYECEVVAVGPTVVARVDAFGFRHFIPPQTKIYLKNKEPKVPTDRFAQVALVEQERLKKWDEHKRAKHRHPTDVLKDSETTRDVVRIRDRHIHTLTRHCTCHRCQAREARDRSDLYLRLRLLLSESEQMGGSVTAR
eukprot:GCRY01004001.1.p1 GENE.GCRY01004001.1~~GCRY01004001.1.p1  ORF type:complete len:503 (+),score=135.61 GCRY01004001.1:205-1713(+)